MRNPLNRNSAHVIFTKRKMDRAHSQGHTAGMNRKSYESNPYHPQANPKMHLAWCSGHNDGRIQIIMADEGRDRDGNFNQ